MANLHVSSRALARPTKEEISVAIAGFLGLTPPPVSDGASVISSFIDEVNTALFGSATGGTDSYRRAERLLTNLGLLYDPRWDSSESRGATGGSTITTRAFSRILVALTGAPRCFLMENARVLAIADLQVVGVAERNPLAEAGPGALVAFYDRRKGDVFAVHSAAQVASTDPGWGAAPWRARFDQHRLLADPVEVTVRGASSGRIVEIPWLDYLRVLGVAGDGRARPSQDNQKDPDVGSGPVATRLDADYPAEKVPINVAVVPPSSGGDVVQVAEAVDPAYGEGEDDVVARGSDTNVQGGGAQSDATANSIAEKRAIVLATRSLLADGWTLTRDRQPDGVGYDLLFERSGRPLKVEVKGIRGGEIISI